MSFVGPALEPAYEFTAIIGSFVVSSEGSKGAAVRIR